MLSPHSQRPSSNFASVQTPDRYQKLPTFANQGFLLANQSFRDGQQPDNDDFSTVQLDRESPSHRLDSREAQDEALD